MADGPSRLRPALAVLELRARYTSGDAPSRRSLAVLPFANLSSDPENEYLSDGITEELLTALASRTSCVEFLKANEEVRATTFRA